LRIDSLPMSSHELSDCPFDLGHPSAAVPAGDKVGADVGSATSGKFAVRRCEQLLIRQVKTAAQHSFISDLHV
jgi:hypothetical protein